MRKKYQRSQLFPIDSNTETTGTPVTFGKKPKPKINEKTNYFKTVKIHNK